MFFVDTNVLVYARDDTDPIKRDRARGVMGLLWESRSGRLSHQVLVEFYSTVTRKLKPGLPAEEARADVIELSQWGPIAPNRDLYAEAWRIEDRFGLSWWDSMIAAAARQAGCAILLSEDLQHGLVIDGLRIVNPFRPEFDIASLGS